MRGQNPTIQLIALAALGGILGSNVAAQEISIEERSREDALELLQGTTEDGWIEPRAYEDLVSVLVAVRRGIPELADTYVAPLSHVPGQLLVVARGELAMALARAVEGEESGGSEREGIEVGVPSFDRMNRAYRARSGRYLAALGMLELQFETDRPLDMRAVARRYGMLSDVEANPNGLSNGYDHVPGFLKRVEGARQIAFRRLHPGDDWSLGTWEFFCVTVHDDGTIVREYYDQFTHGGPAVEPTWPVGWQREVPTGVPRHVPFWFHPHRRFDPDPRFECFEDVDELLDHLGHPLWWVRLHAVVACEHLLGVVVGGPETPVPLVDAARRRQEEVIGRLASLTRDADLDVAEAARRVTSLVVWTPPDLPLPEGAALRLGTPLISRERARLTGTRIAPARMSRWHGDSVGLVAFEAGGDRLVSADRRGIVCVWDPETGTELRRTEHDEWILDLIPGPERVWLLTQTPRERAHVRRSGTDEVWEVPGHASDVMRLVPMSEGKALVIRPEGRTPAIEVLEIPSGREVVRITGRYRTICASPDGRYVAVASSRDRPDAPDPRIAVHETLTGEAVLAFDAPPNGVDRLAFSPDTRWLASAVVTGDGSIRIRDLTTGAEHPSLPGAEDGFQEIAFSPDGRFVAAVERLGGVGLWERASGRRILTFPTPEPWGGAESLAFSPSGRLFATGMTDATVFLWRVPQQGPEGEPSQADEGGASMEDRWTALASPDASAAHRAKWSLVARPEAVAFLRERLRERPRAVAALLGGLDDDAYETRLRARERLVELGLEALPALHAARDEKGSPESVQSVTGIIARIESSGGPVPLEARRSWRAVEVLERRGTPEARSALAEVARASPPTLAVEEARRALARLERR